MNLPKSMNQGWLLALALVAASPAFAETAVPDVKLIHPSAGAPYFARNGFIKFKAEVLSGDVAEVQFFINDTLIGTATNAPYNIVWHQILDGPVAPNVAWLTAVARTSHGEESRTKPLLTYFNYWHLPVPGVLVTPPDGTMMVAGTDLEIGAEVVVSLYRTGTNALSLYFDNQLFATNVPAMNARTPPTKIVIPNVSEGEHTIGVHYSEGGEPCIVLRTAFAPSN